MTEKIKENILAIYDEAINKTKAIKDISKTFNIAKDELKAILREAGRSVPYDRKKDPEQEPAPAAEQTPKVEERKLPIPQVIFEILERELDSLDEEIQGLTDTLQAKTRRYDEIVRYIKGQK